MAGEVARKDLSPRPEREETPGDWLGEDDDICTADAVAREAAAAWARAFALGDLGLPGRLRHAA